MKAGAPALLVDVEHRDRFPWRGGCYPCSTPWWKQSAKFVAGRRPSR